MRWLGKRSLIVWTSGVTMFGLVMLCELWCLWLFLHGNGQELLEIGKFRTLSLFEDHEMVKIGTFWSHLNLCISWSSIYILEVFFFIDWHLCTTWRDYHGELGTTLRFINFASSFFDTFSVLLAHILVSFLYGFVLHYCNVVGSILILFLSVSVLVIMEQSLLFLLVPLWILILWCWHWCTSY